MCMQHQNLLQNIRQYFSSYVLNPIEYREGMAEISGLQKRAEEKRMKKAQLAGEQENFVGSAETGKTKKKGEVPSKGKRKGKETDTEDGDVECESAEEECEKSEKKKKVKGKGKGKERRRDAEDADEYDIEKISWHARAWLPLRHTGGNLRIVTAP
ncbi:hypothetical protein BDN67DRAFT_972422 [Paxillus ammoniavirescens]|nr:hypothetical protein BDN67DRAFT_972422 [Paxillus ammoniavirescens]